MKPLVISSLYCLGSVLFTVGSIYSLIDFKSMIPYYLGASCAFCYLTASGLQVFVDFRELFPGEEK